MMRHYKISVIAIFYNSEEYVRKCVDSILNQSYTNFEMIAVDDCSCDNTLSILREYAARDNRVKIVAHKINRGISGARNSGMDNVTGDCFYFIDGDDWLPTDAFENLVCYFNDNVDWVSGGYDIVDENDNVIRTRSRADGRYNTHKEIDKNFFNLELIWLHNRLIHRKYSSYKFIEGIVHEDQFWNLDIYNQLNHIVNINLSTYKYVSRKTSYSKSSQLKRAFIDDGLALVKMMVKTNNKNWIICAESMTVSTIVKNLYIGRFDSIYRKSVVREIYSSGIFPIRYINIGSFARFQKIMYNLLPYPDCVRNIVAKSYLTLSKIIGREV